MSSFRIIPSLLLKNGGLHKGRKFTNYKYVGDPINAVRIFNAKEVDELFFFDITATSEARNIDMNLISKLSNECYMPFCVGGGISNISTIKKLIKIGVEKVSINSSAVTSPNFVKKASDVFGSQAIVVSIDVKKNDVGKYDLFINSGKEKTELDPVTHAINMENLGAGEIVINSIDRDGMGLGYDIEIVKKLSKALSIPVIASGGCGNIEDFYELKQKTDATAASAGSFFVLEGKLKAVLISYPSKDQIRAIVE